MLEQTPRPAATALAHRGVDDEATALRSLAEVVAGTADLAVAVRDVNRDVVDAVGLRIDSCSLVSTHLRAATGAPAPTDAETDIIEAWRAAARHGMALDPVRADEHVLVPVVHRRRVHGVLRLTPSPTRARPPAATDALLSAIGLGCGEVAWKAGVRRELARSRRRLAIAVEQERSARDAQASLHRRLAALGDRLAAHVADAPDRVWRERMQELLVLTGEADREVRRSLNFLRSLPAQGDDLPASLRSLARGVSATTDVYVKVMVDGEPRRLSGARVDALFHVAVEALIAAAVTARARSAVVVVAYGPGEVRLTVRDDGVGLVHRQLFGSAGSQGLRGAQRRLARVEGRLRLSGMRPHGAVVEATVRTARPGR